MNAPTEVYETQGGKIVILRSAADMLKKFMAVALRINAEGDVELLLVGEEDMLVWIPVTEMELDPVVSIN